MDENYGMHSLDRRLRYVLRKLLSAVYEGEDPLTARLHSLPNLLLLCTLPTFLATHTLFV
jgi:hypothetical protein